MKCVKNFSKILTLILFFSFQACKIAGSKRPTDEQPQTTVMSYFQSEQYRFETPGNTFGNALTKALSSLHGVAFVANTAEASFSNLVSPKADCFYANGEGLIFEPKRSVDIGTFRLSGYGLNEVEVPKEKDNVSQSFYGSLQPGEYQLENSGVQGSLSFSQSFKVPGAGSQFKIYSGDNPAQDLATPYVVGESDPSYLVTVNKTKALTIDFVAPPEATYVRIRISDGTSNQESNVTCYGPTNKPIQIGAGGLNFFRSTDDGVLYIDFVNISLKTNIDKIKESVVVSYSRHVHGLVDFYFEDLKQTMHFGVLRFQ
jgi:hypothetical protein